MFDDMIQGLYCPVCHNSEIQYSQVKTMEAWQDPNLFRLEDVEYLEDGMISDVLVFICFKCSSEFRLTHKEIEKMHRKKLSQRLLTLISNKSLPNPGSIKSRRIMIYCGVCGGVDGKGACPIEFYEICELKRLPNV